MNFSMIFSAVDKASKTMGKIMATEKKMAASMKGNAAKATQANSKTQRALEKTKRAMTGLSGVAKKSFRAVVDGANKAGRAIKSLHNKTVKLSKFGFGQIASGAKRAKTGLVGITAAVTLAYGTAAGAAGALAGTASEFEKYQTILTTTEGSAIKAEQAMNWVQDFAVKTPYELDQVTDSFVKLRAYGLDPTQGLLTSLGDTSAAMGKPLMQAVEAVADAVTGENERLKEFGIKASKTGNKITYAYTNAAGKAVEVAVDAGDRMAIQQKLMGIMNEKYAGSMGRLAQTWDGMVANLWDQWTKFQLMIMKAGLFDWMKDKLSGILDTINKMEADGTLQEWATSIGQSIQTALTNAWNFAQGAYEVISELTGYLSTAADYVGGWKNLSAILAGIAFAPTLISTAAGLVQIAGGLVALSTALMANPIGLAIAGIVGGVYLIYRNWDAIGPYFSALWDNVKSSAKDAWDWLKGALIWSPMELIRTGWEGLQSLISGPIEKGRVLAADAWTGIKDLFIWTPVDFVKSNWAELSATLAGPVEQGRALIETAWEKVKVVFAGEWLPDFPETDWAALVNLQGIMDAWASVTNWFGDAAAGIWDMIPEMPNWVKDAFSIFESTPQVNVDEITRKSVVASGSVDQSAMSAKQLEVLRRMENFRAKHSKPIQLIEDPKTLLAAAEAAQKLEKQFPALSAAAEGALEGTRVAINSMRSLLSQTDFTDQGVALMRTLAQGIRQGTSLVVEATAAATQKVRDHLPSSPAKTGPLSDIHRLKFGETIAASIRAEPMVRAMNAAAAATMAAAMPVAQGMTVATLATPASAAQSVLPSAEQSRAASTPSFTGNSRGAISDTSQGRSVSVTYGDIHFPPVATAETKATFKQMLADHKREIKKLVDDEEDREDRKKF